MASAHGPGLTYIAGTSSAPPTVDGVVNAAEWAGATSYSFPFGTFGNATAQFKYYGGDLYIGVVVQDLSAGLSPSLTAFFDNDHDGVKKVEGDDAWLAFGTFGQDFFWDPDRVPAGATSTTPLTAARRRPPPR